MPQEAHPGSMMVILPVHVAEQVRAAAVHDERTPEEFAIWLLQSALNVPSAPPAAPQAAPPAAEAPGA